VTSSELPPAGGPTTASEAKLRRALPRPALSTVLFDLDGTLLDTVDLILLSYRHTLERHLGTVPPDRIFLRALGTPLHLMFRAFTEDPAEIAAMVETYRVHNAEHHDDRVLAYEGALEAVRAVAARGCKLAVVTSKSRTVSRRGLEVCGFDGLFPTLIAAEDVTRHKPDPEPVRLALERLGARPEEAVFIGDSPFDMESGRRAGVRTAAALWGPFEREELERQAPDHWLADPREIPGLLDPDD
jgi:pyrophosphatase PpaX